MGVKAIAGDWAKVIAVRVRSVPSPAARYRPLVGSAEALARVGAGGARLEPRCASDRRAKALALGDGSGRAVALRATAGLISVPEVPALQRGLEAVDAERGPSLDRGDDHHTLVPRAGHPEDGWRRPIGRG